MVSSDKLKRHDAKCLDPLRKGLKEVHNHDSLTKLLSHLKIAATQEQLASGENLESSSIYQEMLRIDNPQGELKQRFSSDISQLFNKAISEFYEKNPTHEIDLPKPLIIYGNRSLPITRVYSTPQTRNLNDLLNSGEFVIRQKFEHNAHLQKLFCEIANQTGNFYGISKDDLIRVSPESVNHLSFNRSAIVHPYKSIVTPSSYKDFYLESKA